MIHIMLPEQYASRARLAEPHRRLMAAVLRAVVDDCRGGSVYRRLSGKGVIGARSVRKAVAYVASTDRAWPFSFENLCDALGLDAAALREDLILIRGRDCSRPRTQDTTAPPRPGATVVSDRDSGRSRGFGFVEMSSSTEASKAITEPSPGGRST
jgi:hypothetical protein